MVQQPPIYITHTTFSVAQSKDQIPCAAENLNISTSLFGNGTQPQPSVKLQASSQRAYTRFYVVRILGCFLWKVPGLGECGRTPRDLRKLVSFGLYAWILFFSFLADIGVM